MLPTKPAYPGVYLEEISTNVRTITAVSTATAAFVGHTLRGPLDEPVRITSFAEFERSFGGLTKDSAVGYAVHQFFGNAGAAAVIVRVIKEGSAKAACVTLQADESPVLEVHAKEPGRWGSDLRIAIDHATRRPHDTFNLHVLDSRGHARETFHGLSMNHEDHRYAPAAVNSRSALIRVKAVGERRPDPSGTVSRPFDENLPDLDVDLTVSIGHVEREFTLYESHCDGPPPCNVDELARLLERKLRALHDAPGRHAFAGTEVTAFGHRLQIVAGSTDEHDVVRFSGECSGDLGLDDQVNPPVFALNGGEDGDPPGPGELIGDENRKTGIQALRDIDDVNLLCLPELAAYASIEDVATVWSAADRLCRAERMFLLADAPAAWTSVDAARAGIAGLDAVRSDHAGLYFPHVTMTDPLTGHPRSFPPCGAVAGVIARTDGERGVWKAPAGTGARLAGVTALSVPLTDRENGLLGPLGINCLRTFPAVGPVVWGARTLDGAESRDWDYVPVRRLALHVEESLYRGLRWVVFEPNTEQLWQQIRLDASSFLDTLFRQGAFAGTTPRAAYFVRCDATTTTPADIENGVVNVVVGIAPARPAEFVIVKIQQTAGQFES